MADKVEKRLLDRYNSTTALASVTKGGEDDIEDVIEAHFTADEYRIGMGGDVVVDASQSFSFGRNIVEYQ